MAATTHPRFEVLDDAGEHAGPRGGAARAAARRSRSAARRGASPALFAGDGQLRRAAPPVRLTSVPLVAHDDLAPRGTTTVAPVALAAGGGSSPRPVWAGSARDRALELPKPSPSTYRRRRLVAAALVLGALLTGSWVLGALGGGPLTASERGSSSTAAAASAGATVELRVQPVSRSIYVVARGDTLWSIARALQPEGDVRPVVDTLAAARQGRPLEVGETIVLP